MRWNEDRHLAVFQTANADPPLPSRMDRIGRLRISGVDHIVPVDRQPADAAEAVVLADEAAFSRVDLDAMVVAIGDDQPALRIELERVRRAELAGPGSGPANDPQELAGLVEHRDAPDEIRIADIGVTLGDIHVAIP